MLYIDKDKNKAEGKQVTIDYLRECCIDEQNRYCNIDYAGSFHTEPSDGVSFSKRMERVLMENQHKYCCYCMRKMDGSEKVTLEHIIPQSLKSTDDDAEEHLAYYQRVSPLDTAEIALTDTFKGQQATLRNPLPHTVAYNNLVVSCNGTFPDKLKKISLNPIYCCCNHPRGNEKAFPVYFIQQIGCMIDYLKNGEAQAIIGTEWTKEIRETIVNARLNCESLKQIRRLWFILRDCDEQEIYICSSNADKREYLLLKKLFDNKDIKIEEAMNLFPKFNKQDYWDTFMLYHKFYKIYNKNKTLTK